MRWKSLAWFGCLVTSILVPSAAQAENEPAGRFGTIVVFREEADLGRYAASYVADDRAAARPHAWGYLDRGVTGAVQALERSRGFRADHVYSAALRGFAARLTAGQIADLMRDPAVAYVEADGVAHASAQTLPWGIDRVDADVSSTLAGNGSGAVTNVNVYVIDSGIDAGHPDLNVVAHYNFGNGKNTDCHGHGTHVAGTIAARDNASDVVGVAPGAPLTGIKVLGCNASGFWSTIIKGVDWVTANAVKPAVANMSIVGDATDSVDQAVRNSVAAGIVYAISAGNTGDNACDVSPGRTGAGVTNGILNLAATDIDDQEAGFSSYGSCVDLWGPGVDVLSTRRGGGTVLNSGTSMAAPHAAGTAVLYLSAHPTASPSGVEAALRSTAVPTGTLSKDGAAIHLVYAGNY